jgi:hypothetical protein
LADVWVVIRAAFIVFGFAVDKLFLFSAVTRRYKPIRCNFLRYFANFLKAKRKICAFGGANLRFVGC